MSRVEITLRVHYVKCDLAPEEVEWDPELRTFFTGHFQRQAVRIPLGKPHNHVNAGEKSKSNNDNNDDGGAIKIVGTRAADLGDIPATAAIVFQGIAKHRNDYGVPCMIDAGTSHIMLTELDQHAWNSGPFVKDIHLLMHTANNFDKGTVRITIEKQEHVNLCGLKIAAMHINGASDTQLMVNYMKRVLDMGNRMGESRAGTEGVQCPYNFSQDGWQLLGMPTPAQGYMINPELPVSNGLFWTNALERTMAHDGLKPHDWHKLTKVQKARATIMMVVYPIQYLPYIGDKIDRNRRKQQYRVQLKEGMEDFGQALVMWAGDCEDLAKGIMIIMAAFTSYTFGNNSNHNAQAASPVTLGDGQVVDTSTPYDAIFSEMQEYMEQYIPFMSLEVVHGAKAADSTEDYGAHMSNNVEPAHVTKDQMERTKEGRAVSKRLPWPKKMDRDLPVQIGEGTGQLDSYGYKDGLKQVRAYLQQASVVRGFKVNLITEHGKASSFFVSSKQGWTNYFRLRGATDGIGDAFWFTTEPNGTRGAEYTDIVNATDKVGLRPMPRMPDRVAQLTREAAMFRAPPEALVLTKQHAHTRSKVLDRVVQHIDDLGRATDTRPSVVVPLSISPHQLDRHVADQMMEQFAELDRIWKLAYTCEDIVDGIHGWRLMVHVHVDKLN